MLLVGDHNTIVHHSNVVIYNLSSLIEGYERINILPPYWMNCRDERTFDMEYARYILDNDVIFAQFMKIIMSLYEGKHVYIIIQTGDEYYDNVTESLLKFIQQRYGYNYYMINSFEDLEYIKDEVSEFSLPGLYNLDIDKERYSILITKGG